MANEQERIKLLKEIRALQTEIGKLEASLTTSTKDTLAIENQIKKTKAEVIFSSRKLLQANEEIRKQTKLYLQSQIELESRISSISNQQFLIKDIERSRIQNLNTIDTKITSNLDKFNEMSDVNQQIANLSSDEISKAHLLNLEYQDIASSIDYRGKGIQGQLELLDEQNKIATRYASLSETQRDVLEGHQKVIDGIKKSLMGVVETASVLVSTTGGKLGSALLGAGFLMEKLGHVAHHTGTFFDEMTLSATGLSFIFGDATNVAKGLAKELGGIEHASFKAQLQTNLLANNLDISGEEASSLIASFSRLNNNSTDIAASTIQITKTLAKQQGVIPSQVMADMAGSTKAFAEYGKEGGRNIAEAAVYAAKLGVNMDALTSVTDNLLDFETSMTKELELGVLLGRRINLNKARQLAYDGEIGSAAKETLNQLGGIDAFNRMDIYQKRESASLIGLSVEELQKMAANMDKINADGSIQLSQAGEIGQKFDYISEAMKGILTGPGGGFLKMLGSGAIAMGQMGFPLPKIAKGFKSIAGSVAETTKNLLSKGWKMLAGGDTGSQFAGGSLAKGKEILAKRKGKGSIIEKIKDNVVGKKTPKIETDSVSDKLNKTSGGKGMNVTNMLKGAAAILVLSAALYVAAKAFQEFGDVEWKDVGMGLTGLAGLATIAMILGKAQGQMIKGALAVAILGAALIPFSFAMNLIAGVDMSSVLSVAAGLVIFSAAIFGLGALMSSGVGAFIFGAGLVAIAGLGIAMGVLGAGLLVAGMGIQKIGDSMGSIVSTITKTQEVIGSVGSTLVGIVAMIGSIAMLSLAFGGLGVSLMLLGVAGLIALPAILGIGSSLKSMTPIIEAFGNTIKVVFSGISSFVETFGNTLTSIFSGIGSFIKSFGNTLLTIFAGIGSSITNVIGGISSAITSIFSGIGNTITNVFSGISTFVKSFGNIITSVFSGISSAITGIFSGISNIFKSVASIFQSFGNTISNIFGGVSSIFESITSSLQSFGTVITTIFSGISSLVESVASGFVTLMDSVTSEKIQNMLLLGPALASAAIGLGAFAIALGTASIGNFFGGGILSSLGELSGMATGLSMVGLSLMSIGMGIGLISANLTKLDTEKLEALKDFSTTISIGNAITGIANSITGVIDSVSGVEKGSVSEYEIKMLQKMDELIGAVKSNKDVYIDKEKVTNTIIKSSEKQTENLFGLGVA